MTRIVGVDVGGTFTDLVMVETSGARREVKIAKVPTTSGNQAEGVMKAIAAVDVDPAVLDLVIHGTTVTTNALLERKIATVGLITTSGFRDVLELGRRTRPKPYGLFGTFEPLIERQNRLEVAERMSAHGEVLTPLDEDAVARQAKALIAQGCEALVIHFLHAYANPAHEIRAGEIARALWPNGYVTLGHELLSEFREYERGTTASVNAAVQPVLDRYVDFLRDELAKGGFKRDLLVMNGNGGTVRADIVAREAAKTVMSGPASGVMAAVATMAQAGVKHAITYDMGGTSTDVALIRDGTPEVSSELSIDYGLPVHLPMVDVRTIGAGGGSIASVNAAGLLQVGPRSAGSTPGPICYGRGGTEPTITDANVVLGRLDAARVSATGGADAVARAREAIEERIGAPLGLSVERAAEAIIALGNVHMSGAIRLVSLSRGHDPRDFALFAFGGAGPLHATALARELGVPDVLIPARPGLTNALGCVVADLRQDFVRTLNSPLSSLSIEDLQAIFAEHEDAGRRLNSISGDEIARTVVEHSLDMQFQGQTHLIRVPLGPEPLDRETIRWRFDEVYDRRFQVRLPELAASVVNANTSVIGRRHSMKFDMLMGSGPRRAALDEATTGMRRLFTQGEWVEAPVIDRESMPLDAMIEGPAIVEQRDATTFIEPDCVATVDAIGNLRIRISA
ncbi:hydantoinase/oxoprolinase family protein [Terrarubrum flagellatum]|uniref:hydantoinase/oxoprolinase family protein n=1 Tax=Terrirubrum flagellatum TaxID=2895980 RepID=UPI003145512A